MGADPGDRRLPLVRQPRRQQGPLGTPPAAAGVRAAPQARPPQQGAGRGNAAAAHTPAYMIKISARPDGSFTVTNTRNGFSKTYAARPRAR